MTLLACFLGLAFAYTLVSARLDRTFATGPIVFTTAGLLLLLGWPGLWDQSTVHGLSLRIAELGLVMLLFTEASRIDRAALRASTGLPVRLLTTGMLLTILLGGLLAFLVLPGLSVWEAGVLAAILAPTDAGLGEVIVNDERVPARIRRALNVEAGLNDGLSVPFLLFFLALAGAGSGAPGSSLVRLILEQLGLGAVVGLAIGLGGGWLLARAHQRGWMSESRQQLAVVALPLFCVLASEAVGASMFIAAFVAGLAVQVRFPEAGRRSAEFTEQGGALLNLAVFFLFGMAVARDWRQLELVHGVYAVLSLTVVRILPVAVALRGTRLSRATVLFMGWFGPRGLASIVLALVYLEHVEEAPGPSPLLLSAMATVLLSIYAHGLSARPGIRAYAARVAALGADAPEHQGG